MERNGTGAELHSAEDVAPGPALVVLPLDMVMRAVDCLNRCTCKDSPNVDDVLEEFEGQCGLPLGWTHNDG